MMDELDKLPALIVLACVFLVSGLLSNAVPAAALVQFLAFLGLAALLFRRWCRAANARSRLRQAPTRQREPVSQPFQPAPTRQREPVSQPFQPARPRPGETCPGDNDKIVFATQAEARDKVESSRETFVLDGPFDRPLDHEYYCRHCRQWHVSSKKRR